MNLATVRAAVEAVTDPEYPDLTIAALGMVHTVDVATDGTVTVELLPTVLGCPALRVIEADVCAAVRSAVGDGTQPVDVRFLAQPAWTPDRISASARQHLAQEYTITIRGRDGRAVCPVCGGKNLEERSPFGPTLCRSVSYCPDCRNPVEVVRTRSTFAGVES